MQKGQQNQEKLDQKLIWYFGCLRDPQTHPGAKKTPQMACESQIWPRCTPRGITRLFRTKELIFETDRSKLSHFTRNYPPAKLISKSKLNKFAAALCKSIMSWYLCIIVKKRYHNVKFDPGQGQGQLFFLSCFVFKGKEEAGAASSKLMNILGHFRQLTN